MSEVMLLDVLHLTTYLETLLLLELNAHEDDHTGSFRGGVDVVLLVIVDYHVV